MAFPTTSILSTFSGADENPITTDWTSNILADGDMQIVSNRLTSANISIHCSAGYDLATMGSGDIEVYATIPTGSSSSAYYPSLLVKMQNLSGSPANGYKIRFRKNSSEVRIYRLDNGVATLLGASMSLPGGVALANGDGIGTIAKNDASGTIEAWFKDGAAAWALVGSRADTTYKAVDGYIGINSLGNTTFDDFGGGLVSSGLTINATTATADAFGYAANVDRQTSIAATTASGDTFGYTAAVDRQTAIAATTATADATGYLATVDRQTVITTTTATADASGFPATVDRQAAIAASVATADASGFPATVDRQTAIEATTATADAFGYIASYTETVIQQKPTGGGGWYGPPNWLKYEQRLNRRKSRKERLAEESPVEVQARRELPVHRIEAVIQEAGELGIVLSRIDAELLLLENRAEMLRNEEDAIAILLLAA